MRRLYLQIYLTFVGILLLFGFLMLIAWWLIPGDDQDRRSLDGVAALLGEVLPPPGRPVPELQAKVDRLARQFNADVTLRTADGALLANAGVREELRMSLVGHAGRDVHAGYTHHELAVFRDAVALLPRIETTR